MEPADGYRRVEHGRSAISVRPGNRGDADALLGLIDALADYESLERPSAEARRRLIEDGFGPSPRFRVFLVEIDGRPEGYAIVLHTYSSFLALPTLFIEDIFVREEARGRGAGGALFRYLARLALDEGCGRMEWMVLDWNEIAIGFYERMGATRLAEWLPYRLTRSELLALDGDLLSHETAG